MRTANSRRVGRAIVVSCVALVAAGGWWQGHDSEPGAPHKTSSLAAVSSPAKPVSVSSAYAQQPLAFEPNRGQSDGRVLFLSRNAGYALFLTAGEAVVNVRGAQQPLRLAWQGANLHPQVAGLDTLPGKHNYLKGNDPARWQRDVPTYGKVRYRDLYPGIDLVYYGQQRQLEYDLVVAPGADPGQIRLRLAGMEAVTLDDEGALHLQLARQTLSLSKPLIYQETAGAKKTVDGGYVLLADNQVGFKLAAYDIGKPLIIDPVLTYSGYLGGGGAEQGKGVAVDGSGNVYVVGQTASADFPGVSSGSYQTSNAGGDTDVFVAKFDNTGTLLAATYLGGSGTDRGFAIAADNGAVYITGDTSSTTFPKTVGQTYGGGTTDAFVARLDSANLNLSFSTYLGGANSEEALGLAVDATGVYVTGATISDDFPKMTGTFNLGLNSTCKDPSTGNNIFCSDAFVAKYDLTGNKQYAALLGGSLQDAAQAIAVDSATNEVYVTGVTYSSANFPTTSGVFQPLWKGGLGDAFLATLNAAGDTFTYVTYLGGSGWDQGQAIALDNGGNVYVAGVTNSEDLPVTGQLQRKYAGGQYDAFVARINPAASTQLQFLSYLGGSKKDFAFGIAAKADGTAVVVGETLSADFPISDPLQSVWLGSGQNNWGDAFVTEIDATGFSAWSTYLGGGGDDWANAVAIDAATGNKIYVAGSSYSSDFPTAGSGQLSAAGDSDAVLFRLDDTNANADVALSVTATPAVVNWGETLTYRIVITNNSTSTDAAGVAVAATLPSGLSYQSSTPANSCTGSGTQALCSADTIAPGGSTTIDLTAMSNAAGDITFTAKTVRAHQPDGDATNNSASVTSKAAVGDSSGGGVWSPLEWLLGLTACLSMRRRAAILR